MTVFVPDFAERETGGEVETVGEVELEPFDDLAASVE